MFKDIKSSSGFDIKYYSEEVKKMRKKIKVSIIAVAVVLLGTLAVSATEEVISTWRNYSVNAGQFTMANGLSAGYNYAKAVMNVDSVGSGPNRTFFRAYRYDNKTYVLKQQVDAMLNTNTSTTKIGFVQAGTWRLCNYAYNPNNNTQYSSWTGSLQYISSDSY